MFKLEKAQLRYGTSAYDMHFLFDADKLFREVPFAPLEGEVLDAICQAVAHCTGCLGAEHIKARIRHNVAVTEQKIDLPDGKTLTIPASVQLIGNGFSLIWKEK